MRRLRKRYGSVFTMDLPFFGKTVIVSDRAMIKQVFTTPTDVLANHHVNLGSVLGPTSMFALDGDEHRRMRKLVLPPFAGRRISTYADDFERETLRESESWPLGSPFSILDATNRITLNVILRTVFGAEGAEFEELRELLPGMVAESQRLDALGFLRHDLGPWSPWGRYLARRRRFDAVVQRLIDQARSAPDLTERRDVLALLLQTRYEDGSQLSDQEVADQMLTVLAAGHETTANSLAWSLERLSRHPALLQRLVAEIDAGESQQLLQATVTEILRIRPVVDVIARYAAQDVSIGEWRLPQGCSVFISIQLLHEDESVFADARRFGPSRFVGSTPDHYAWIPFGGGTRRCIGAGFATMEMSVVLTTLLKTFELSATYAPGERWHDRGVTFAPAGGGRVVLHRRRPARVLPAAVQEPDRLGVPT